MSQVQERRLRDVQALTTHLEQVKKQVGKTMIDFHDLSRSMELLAEAFFGLSVLDSESYNLQSASKAFLKEVREINEGPAFTAFREAVQNNVQGRLRAVEDEAAIAETAAVEALEAFATLEKKRQRADREAAKLAKFSSQHAAESSSKATPSGGGNGSRISNARRQSVTGSLTSAVSRSGDDDSSHTLSNWGSSWTASTQQDSSRRRPNSGSRYNSEDGCDTPESRELSVTDALRSATAEVETQRKNYDGSVRKCNRLINILRDTNSTESRDALKIFTDECGSYLRKLVVILEHASTVLGAASSYPEGQQGTAGIAMASPPSSAVSAGDQGYVLSLYEREAAAALNEGARQAALAPHGTATTSAPFEAVEKPYRPYWTVQPRGPPDVPTGFHDASSGGAAEAAAAPAVAPLINGIVLSSTMAPDEPQPVPAKTSSEFMPPISSAPANDATAFAASPAGPDLPGSVEAPLFATAPVPSVSQESRHRNSAADAALGTASPSPHASDIPPLSQARGSHSPACASGYYNRRFGSARYGNGPMFGPATHLPPFQKGSVVDLSHRASGVPLPLSMDVTHRSHPHRAAQPGGHAAMATDSHAKRALRPGPLPPPRRVATMPLPHRMPVSQTARLPPVHPAETQSVGAQPVEELEEQTSPSRVLLEAEGHGGTAVDAADEEPQLQQSMNSFSFSALRYVDDEVPFVAALDPSSMPHSVSREGTFNHQSGYSFLYSMHLGEIEEVALASPTVDPPTRRCHRPSFARVAAAGKDGRGGNRAGDALRHGSSPCGSAPNSSGPEAPEEAMVGAEGTAHPQASTPSTADSVGHSADPGDQAACGSRATAPTEDAAGGLEAECTVPRTGSGSQSLMKDFKLLEE